jgi:hypothetical protein
MEREFCVYRELLHVLVRDLSQSLPFLSKSMFHLLLEVSRFCRLLDLERAILLSLDVNMLDGDEICLDVRHKVLIL